MLVASWIDIKPKRIGTGFSFPNEIQYHYSALPSVRRIASVSIRFQHAALDTTKSSSGQQLRSIDLIRRCLQPNYRGWPRRPSMPIGSQSSLVNKKSRFHLSPTIGAFWISHFGSPFLGPITIYFTKVSNMTTGDSALMLCGVWATI